jgi:hypothetical protein
MTNSDIIASGALIIALISVFIAMRQLGIQQNHNKKSLKPLGNIDLGDYEDNLYAKISNHGLGPLIIETIEVSKDGITKSDIMSFLPDLPKGKYYKDFVIDMKDKIITPNNSIYLFDISFEKSEVDLIEDFRLVQGFSYKKILRPAGAIKYGG